MKSCIICFSPWVQILFSKVLCNPWDRTWNKSGRTRVLELEMTQTGIEICRVPCIASWVLLLWRDSAEICLLHQSKTADFSKYLWSALRWLFSLPNKNSRQLFGICKAAFLLILNQCQRSVIRCQFSTRSWWSWSWSHWVVLCWIVQRVSPLLSFQMYFMKNLLATVWI